MPLVFLAAGGGRGPRPRSSSSSRALSALRLGKVNAYPSSVNHHVLHLAIGLLARRTLSKVDKRVLQTVASARIALHLALNNAPVSAKDDVEIAARRDGVQFAHEQRVLVRPGVRAGQVAEDLQLDRVGLCKQRCAVSSLLVDAGVEYGRPLLNHVPLLWASVERKVARRRTLLRLLPREQDHRAPHADVAQRTLCSVDAYPGVELVHHLLGVLRNAPQHGVRLAQMVVAAGAAVAQREEQAGRGAEQHVAAPLQRVRGRPQAVQSDGESEMGHEARLDAGDERVAQALAAAQLDEPRVAPPAVHHDDAQIGLDEDRAWLLLFLHSCALTVLAAGTTKALPHLAHLSLLDDT